MMRYSRQFLKIVVGLLVLSLLAVTLIYYTLAPKLPDTNTLKTTQLQVPLRIFSSEGLLLAEFGEKRRIPVQFEDIPTTLIQAFLAAEDDRFYQHPGVDYQGILRAAFALLTTGNKSQGGSTITMQVARNFYLSNEKTYLRKLNEIILALEIEKILTKHEILTLYLNKIYLGNRSYGVGAAANVYYGRPLNQLTLAEMAMIAGLPKAPSTYNPVANPERAITRRNYVLKRMLEVGYISEQAYLEAREAPITAKYHSREIQVYAPYVAEMVRTKLLEEYGDAAYTDGFNVYTTIHAKHQQAMNSAMQTALLAYDRRHGYRGAIHHVDLKEQNDGKDSQLNDYLKDYEKIGPLHPALVIAVKDKLVDVFIKDIGPASLTLDSFKWARKQLSTNSRGPQPKRASDVFQVGDIIRVEKLTTEAWRLAQLPEAQGAMVSVAPYDGAVTAMKGGFDFFNNKFNRVTQSRRQPGSGFKPFIYSAALEKGYTAASIINDAPVVFDDPALDNVWRPENYSGKFFGPTRLRVALTHSRNLVSIRLLRDIGPNYAVNYAEKFGFSPEQLHKNLSLALGSGSAAPWDMARAYSSLANGGYRVEPYLIQRIEDAKGNVIEEARPATVCETCLMGMDSNTDIVVTSDTNANMDTSIDSETTTEKTSNTVTAVETNAAIETSTNTITEHSFKPAQRIMTPQNNYIMNSLLRDVIKYGTGRKALTLGRSDIAGKTGTTNNQVDAWFNGFHPELVAISWVGFDTPDTLGRYETGGRAALPMWIDFMKEVLPSLPEEPLREPVNMVTVKIDPETGLLARPEATDAIYETFREAYVPMKMAPATTGEGIRGESKTPVIDLF